MFRLLNQREFTFFFFWRLSEDRLDVPLWLNSASLGASVVKLAHKNTYKHNTCQLSLQLVKQITLTNSEVTRKFELLVNPNSSNSYERQLCRRAKLCCFFVVRNVKKKLKLNFKGLRYIVLLLFLQKNFFNRLLTHRSPPWRNCKTGREFGPFKHFPTVSEK